MEDCVKAVGGILVGLIAASLATHGYMALRGVTAEDVDKYSEPEKE